MAGNMNERPLPATLAALLLTLPLAALQPPAFQPFDRDLAAPATLVNDVPSEVLTEEGL